MKTLQLLPSLDVGGVERGVIDLAKAMAARGHQTVVISSGGELVGELQKMGVAHYTLPVHKKSLMSLALIPKIAKIIRREQIDVVHGRSRVPAWLGWFACRQTDVPFVTTCHGYYSKHMLSRVMGWGKRVIAISRVVGRHMIDDFKVPPDRIRLVHRGIDLSHFTFVPNRYSKRPETLRIINLGRLSPIKGQMEFLKAIHFLRQKLQRIEVLIVGSEGKGKTKYTEKLEESIRQLGLQSCVKMLGTRRDVPELIAESDLLVLSTLVPEAFGRVVVEAGAVGTAVVATRVGGVLDIIDHEENGLLVPPGDSPAMADAMFRMLTDRDFANQCALKLHEKACTQFTLESMMDKTIDVYKEVCAEKKILIIKLGAMGDLILNTPSFRMIRNRFPQASISLLVDKKLAPLVSTSPHIDEIIPIDRSKLSKSRYLLKLAKRLRREGFDLSVDFQNSKWTHLLAGFSGIAERYGFARGKFGFLINRPDYGHAKPDPPVKHQFRILSKLGVSELDEALEIQVDEDAQSEMDEKLKTFNPNGASKIIGFAMGSSPQWPTKRWPAPYFVKLAETLIKEHRCKIVLIGSAEEEPDSHILKSFGEEHVLNLVGKTTLKQLISAVKRMDVLVTGDTAPLHVAGACGTKIVSFFGPTDPRRHMPPVVDAISLTRHLACQPCYKGECHFEDTLACLKNITSEEVLQAVLKQLSKEEGNIASPADASQTSTV